MLDILALPGSSKGDCDQEHASQRCYRMKAPVGILVTCVTLAEVPIFSLCATCSATRAAPCLDIADTSLLCKYIIVH